jgi:hypothetical protein
MTCDHMHPILSSHGPQGYKAGQVIEIRASWLEMLLAYCCK